VCCNKGFAGRVGCWASRVRAPKTPAPPALCGKSPAAGARPARASIDECRGAPPALAGPASGTSPHHDTIQTLIAICHAPHVVAAPPHAARDSVLLTILTARGFLLACFFSEVLPLGAGSKTIAWIKLISRSTKNEKKQNSIRGERGSHTSLRVWVLGARVWGIRGGRGVINGRCSGWCALFRAGVGGIARTLCAFSAGDAGNEGWPANERPGREEGGRVLVTGGLGHAARAASRVSRWRGAVPTDLPCLPQKALTRPPRTTCR
jgi:hypothetical protein